MRMTLSLCCIFFLAACERPAPAPGDVEIGRYRFVAATSGYPAMVLDTATGCVEQLWVRGEGKDVVVDKAAVVFGLLGKDNACSASGITAIREGIQK